MCHISCSFSSAALSWVTAPPTFNPHNLGNRVTGIAGHHQIHVLPCQQQFCKRPPLKYVREDKMAQMGLDQLLIWSENTMTLWCHFRDPWRTPHCTSTARNEPWGEHRLPRSGTLFGGFLPSESKSEESPPLPCDMLWTSRLYYGNWKHSQL
jgi:hypothetical protein